MESDEEERQEGYLQRSRESKENFGSSLEGKMEELAKTKEELKRAKDSAMQSWLDSKPLIDELERLKAGLATAKNRYSMSNIVVSELESEFETIAKSIMSKKEEEVKAASVINELSKALDEKREELETLKLATDEERRARLKLKQVLRLKKQTLRMSQLTLRAARIESEAFGASAAEALRHIKISEVDTTIVQLTHEEYHALKRRAKEEASLADWRISVSMEQKQAAETSRNFALSRLKQSYSDNRLKRRRLREEKTIERRETAAREMAEEDLNIKVEAQENISAIPKARPKVVDESSKRNPLQHRRSRSIHDKRLVKKKKTSIFHQIKSFIVRSFTRLFG
ncbi:Protein WEAK CHLOROPLAST MOVEMENT UNDER BLUE LIGHT 1 like [Melia azedarach]|uniref:Protein WEAK CHLOROPLAST MOVEMENT UNDER BLUE LIGHT 1 like n=1 Tax=Melia azedarach TaxID=155640 RepID=A0ACC1XTW2_MELAZ|nr:Protein WEAK CHLOROPLAST MOVEMENT UNDER BLUE LIGHT 1 like [Melia azedarach]